MLTASSQKLFRTAGQLFAGGVNSPVRAFKAVGGTPIFIKKGRGAEIWDEDGNHYIDYCLSWGALIQGHAATHVAQAIARQAKRGTSFGACTVLEIRLAALLRRLYPNCQRFRFMSSGTEAVMTAIRLARGITSKRRIIKFEGGYHGHSDSLLIGAGSGLATLGKPTSLGISPQLAAECIVLPYNDPEALKKAFSKYKDIALVIVEPVAGNMGVIPAKASFLKIARDLTQKHKAMLIFDEVITGFHAGRGGAQARLNIKPDLTTLGKVMGGGLPIGALGGPQKYMQRLAPQGGVYQAGTLSGNPLSMVAGISTLQYMKRGFEKGLERKCRQLAEGLKEVFFKNHIPVQIPHFGSMFSIFFSTTPLHSFKDIPPHHAKIYKKFFHHMLKKGIYLPPSAYEACFISSAHTANHFQSTMDAIKTFKL
jgi:glutamate-1-semialdehyde 2,1-aminomutase